MDKGKRAQRNIDEYKFKYAKQKKLDSKEYILYDFVYIKFWKRQSHRTEIRSVVASKG